MLSTTAIKAINYYGGAGLWQKHKYIEAEVSCKGLAFSLKHRPFFNHCLIKMEINKPFSKLTGISKNKNIVGVLNNNDVWLENNEGKILAMRKNARSFFPFGRRLFWWDDMDISYFSNYAFWNYFTLPNLLMNPEIIWQEIKEGHLRAQFPGSIPTHSKIQDFFFDKISGQLLQHNYAVDIISKYAKPANVILKHTQFNGINVATSRLVTPTNKKGVPLKRPVLIDITVHDFKFLG